jgi:hypothetical protein
MLALMTAFLGERPAALLRRACSYGKANAVRLSRRRPDHDFGGGRSRDAAVLGDRTVTLLISSLTARAAALNSLSRSTKPRSLLSERASPSNRLSARSRDPLEVCPITLGLRFCSCTFAIYHRQTGLSMIKIIKNLTGIPVAEDVKQESRHYYRSEHGRRTTVSMSCWGGASYRLCENQFERLAPTVVPSDA